MWTYTGIYIKTCTKEYYPTLKRKEILTHAWRHSTKWNMPATKGQILCDSMKHEILE